MHDLLMPTFRSRCNHTLYKLILSTFDDLFFGILNVSLVGKLNARRVVVRTELCSYFLVAHKVGRNFFCILILGLNLNWRNVRL